MWVGRPASSRVNTSEGTLTVALPAPHPCETSHAGNNSDRQHWNPISYNHCERIGLTASHDSISDYFLGGSIFGEQKRSSHEDIERGKITAST